MAQETNGSFSARIIAWQGKNGRHNLPWQGDNPYHVWLSEIMLQQTQVVKVIDYFKRFIAAFSTLRQLAEADEQSVMALWSGLGYYNRARNLHKAAQVCVEHHNGQLPDSMADLMALPGIGRTTAAAIMSLAYNRPEPILDGNVKRVLARYFMVSGEPGSGPTLKKLWQLAEQQQTSENPRAYSQGLMDLGATLCTKHRPKCTQCPLQNDCMAYQAGVTDHYPEKKKKPKVKAVDLYLYLGVTQNKPELIQRDDIGIWSKMWFLPEYKDEQSLLKNHPDSHHLATMKHVLTHRRLSLHVYISHVDKPRQPPINRDNLLTLPHPTALTHILDYYDNHHLP